MAAQTTQDFWGQFEVAEYDTPQYDWGQYEEVPQNKHALDTSLKELPQDNPYVQTQKQQTDLLANMLFTQDEIKTMEQQGEMGWVEYRSRGFVGWSDITPVLGTVKQVYQSGKALSISKKLEKGEDVSDADKAYMKDYLRNYVECQKRGLSWSAKGASMFVQAPSFMIEFALSGGLGEVAAKGVAAASAKGASKLAVKGATKAAARIAGQQAVLVPMYATANYNERKIADGLNITDKGDMIFNSAQAESNNKVNALKGLGTGEIQILSEMSGGVIGKMASGITGAIGKGLGKVATTNTARGISATSAKIYNSLPKNVRVKLEAAARVADNMRKGATKAGQKAKEAGDLVGFHGVAEEMGEERAEDILMTAFDLDSKEGYSADQWMSAIFPEPQELLLEAGIFSIVGATSLATRTVANDLISKGYSEQEATTITQNLSEIEKENMANEILGEVKINEDIKEQDVIKEQFKIENNMIQAGISMNVNAQGEEINPVDVQGETSKPKNLTDYKQEISAQKFENHNLPYVHRGSYKGRAWSRVLQGSIDNEIVYAERDFNSLISELYKNPNVVNDSEQMTKLEEKLDKITNRLPEEPELLEPFYEKFYNAINSASEYSKLKESRNKVAAEMYDMADNELYDISEETPKKTPKTLKEVEEVATEEAEKIEEEKGLKDLFKDFKETFNNFIEPFYKEAVDRFAPIQNTVRKANKKGANLGIELTDKNWSDNPYNMARMYSGLANRIWQHFTENTTKRSEDGTQKVTGEGFGTIIEDLYKQTKDVESNKKTQLKDFEDYLIARRYLLDLKDRDGYEATDAQKLKAIEDMARITEKYGEDITVLEKLADRVYKYNQRTLHLLVDSGNMSQETYDNIIENNPHHISYKRVMDDNYGMNGLSFAKGKFTDAKSPVKKIRGSEREIQSIYKSTLEDTMRIIDVAERNRIAKGVADLREYLPEEIKPIRPKMEKRTAKVKVTYDAKMRKQLEEAIKFFGRTFKNVKSIKTPTGYALGSYSEEEKMVRKKLGSQDRTLAHEVGHMLDYALDVEKQIKKNAEIMKELNTLAEDRFASTVKLEDGEFVTEDGGSSDKYKKYVKSNKEMIANAFDLYFTSRDYVKRVAPETAKFIDNLFKGDYKFLNDIRPSSETATEEIEQDVWTPSNLKPSPNAIGYYEDGKRKFVEVSPALMEAVEDVAINPAKMGKIFEVIDKALTTSSTLLRSGATLNPEFILRNPIRDIQEAWFNVDGFNPIIDVPKGLMAVIGKNNSKLYKEWQREGGQFNSYMELNEKSIQEALGLYEKERPLIWKALGFVPEQLEKLSSTLEESTRLGIYNAMLRKGLTPTQAAFMAREGTLDFARGGKAAKALNRYITFFNAGIQGTDRVARTLINNPKQALARALQMAAAQLLLSGYYLYAAPDDDKEEYLEIPEWQKNTAYVFKAGGKWWKIPRAFAPGYMFQAIPEKFMIWLATHNKPEGLELYNFAKDLFTSASPITDFSDFIPPIGKVILETETNYNFFTGRQIYPEYLNQYEPRERYNKSTTETAKLLGDKLNMSPALIENAIRGQFGGMGTHALNLGDFIQDNIKKAIGEEVNEKPYELTNYPVAKGFSVKEPVGNNSQSLNTFYKNYKELSEIHNTYNKKKNENKQEAREYKEAHSEELRNYKILNNASDDIKDLRDRINKIAKNTNLDGKEKAEQIKVLEKQMTEKARKANEKTKE